MVERNLDPEDQAALDALRTRAAEARARTTAVHAEAAHLHHSRGIRAADIACYLRATPQTVTRWIEDHPPAAAATPNAAAQPVLYGYVFVEDANGRVVRDADGIPETLQWVPAPPDIDPHAPWRTLTGEPILHDWLVARDKHLQPIYGRWNPEHPEVALTIQSLLLWAYDLIVETLGRDWLDSVHERWGPAMRDAVIADATRNRSPHQLGIIDKPPGRPENDYSVADIEKAYDALDPDEVRRAITGLEDADDAVWLRDTTADWERKRRVLQWLRQDSS